MADNKISADDSNLLQQKKMDLHAYLDTLLPVNLQRMSKEIPQDTIGQTMVYSVGLSPEPIVLSLALLKPEQVLFLVTRKSRDILAMIMDWAVQSSCFQPHGINSIQHETDKQDAVEIYRTIEQFHKRQKVGRILIDFTGGTKPMSAACLMASTEIGARLIYIDMGEQNEPGHERLLTIPNPMVFTGDQLRSQARLLYDSNQFSQARAIYELMDDELISDAVRAEKAFMRQLCTFYEHVDRLDFLLAQQCADGVLAAWTAYQAIRLAESNGNDALFKKFNRTGNKLAYLQKAITRMAENQIMVDEIRISDWLRDLLTDTTWLICMTAALHMTARRRADSRHFDMAIATLYRLTEFLSQCRIADYQMTSEGLSKNCKRLQQRNDAFLAGNPYSAARKGAKTDVYKKLIDCCKKRNQSIYAHGFSAVYEQDWQQFIDLIEKELLPAFLGLIGLSVQDYTRTCQTFTTLKVKDIAP